MSEITKDLTDEEVKKKNEDNKYWFITRVAVPLMLMMCLYDKLFPEECIEKAQVLDIISVEGTKATFKFSNGKTETISYGNLKRGDTYCMASARKNKYFN